MSSYWVFSAKPMRYAIEEVVAERARTGKLDLWGSKGADLRAGDKALVWKQKGTGAHRGVVAIANVVSDPTAGSDERNPHWLEKKLEGSSHDPRVRVRYHLIPGLPLWLDSRDGRVLEQLSVSRGRGSVFHVSAAQWRAVLDALPRPERPDASAYCRRLIGTDVFTINTRRPNRILEVSEAAVRVTTERSPAGDDVPLDEIDAAFKQLFERGELAVAMLGSHRTFLGALLVSLPQAMPYTNPDRIVLAGVSSPTI